MTISGDSAITYRADMSEHFLRRFMRRLPQILAGTMLLVMIASLFCFALFWRWAFQDIEQLPTSTADLWEVRREASITVLDAEGRTLTVRGPLYGQIARLADLPDYVPQAFIAIEDERFYEHDGVDRRGLLRAVLVNLQAGRTLQGGSTLTMQLIKNLILTPERTLRRKLQEMRLALALERLLDKDEILELYLNRVYLGEQAYGIEAAAQRYFRKPASELTLQEAALLAALPKAPSRLAPTANLEEAQARAADVLQAMLNQGYIDSLTYLAAVSTPAEPVEGSAEVADPAGFGHIFDAASAEASVLLGPDATAPDLVIVTTIDAPLQRAAFGALNSQLASEGARLNASEAALVALAPSGAIRAMVGGRSYLGSQFNRATQARRQPGSAFKPIVFAAAFEADYDSASTFEDSPVDIEGWQPENFGGTYRGLVTLEDALKRSINTVAARVGQAIGPQAVVEMAHRLGIDSELPAVPSIALGAAEVSLQELTAAYSVFANDGRRRPPFLISEIRTSRGQILYQREARETAPVITRDHAREMSTMMQGVILAGTGQRASLGNRPAAGKTGTSQNSRDAWFVGYTANYTTGVWVGNDDDTPMNEVTGGGLPAMIWRDFMLAAHRGLPVTPLSAPAPRQRSEREERLVAFYSALSSRFEAMSDDPSR